MQKLQDVPCLMQYNSATQAEIFHFHCITCCIDNVSEKDDWCMPQITVVIILRKWDARHET